jgi:hypothetical protein
MGSNAVLVFCVSTFACAAPSAGSRIVEIKTRVVRATRKAGQVAQPHSHPGPFGGLSLNNCSLLSTSADGTAAKYLFVGDK